MKVLCQEMTLASIKLDQPVSGAHCLKHGVRVSLTLIPYGVWLTMGSHSAAKTAVQLGNPLVSMCVHGSMKTGYLRLFNGGIHWRVSACPGASKQGD